MSARSEARERPITGAELLQRGDLGPCELVGGTIVPMGPTNRAHGAIQTNVSTVLATFVRAHRLGQVLSGDVGIHTRRNPDSVRGADVLYISDRRLAQQRSAGGFLEVAPELVVEILSPRDTAIDVAAKLREYFAIGVVLVWVIDPSARRVLVHRTLTDVRELTDGDRLYGDDVLPGFEVPVAAIFDW